jgi:hypothetical protein
MRISIQLIASGTSKHSLMPQSRKFANCEQFEAPDERQIIRMQHLFSNQLEQGMLVSYGCCQFSTKLRLGKGNHDNSRKATSRVGRVCIASARLGTQPAIRKQERSSASSHPFDKIYRHARGWWLMRKDFMSSDSTLPHHRQQRWHRKQDGRQCRNVKRIFDCHRFDHPREELPWRRQVGVSIFDRRSGKEIHNYEAETSSVPTKLDTAKRQSAPRSRAIYWNI